MVEHLKHEGTSHSSSDLLKIFVKMGASWSAQDFRQAGVTLSGPGSFFLFCFRKTWHTSSSLIWIAGVRKRGKAGDVNGCVESWSGRVCFFFFKSATELIQIVWLLLILHSAGGWCLVTGEAFHTFPHWSRITGRELYPSLIGIIPLCYSDILFQCVFGQFIQDFITLPVSIFCLAWQSCLSFAVNHGLSLL